MCQENNGASNFLEANKRPSYKAGAFWIVWRHSTLVAVKCIDFKSYFLRYTTYHGFEQWEHFFENSIHANNVQFSGNLHDS